MVENKISKINEQECCPKFDPKPWDEKTIEWKNKLFVRKSIFTLFYMPLGMDSIIKKTIKQMTESKTMPERNNWLMLAYSPSMWKTELYFYITKHIDGLDNVRLSGKFLTKVYEGSFNECGNWVKDIKDYIKRKTGKEPKKIFANYTTCPKCAKKYGKNYVVMFAQIL
jgi:hypothetical protein